MEDFLSSTNYKTKSCYSRDNAHTEESGWSLYLEDLIPDDFDVENRHHFAKRRRITSNKVSPVDQELEDTATSPSRSPQVCDMNHLYMSSKEMGIREVYQKTGYTSQHAKDINMDNMETSLRRKGLCLVPMSMALSVNLS